MGGGLLHLAANEGYESTYLVSEPQITLFKSVYRRHTLFSRESIPLRFNSNPDFGKTVTCKILPKGDLVHRLVLAIEIPELAPTFNNSKTHDLKHLINSVSLADTDFLAKLRAADVRQIIKLLQTQDSVYQSMIDNASKTELVKVLRQYYQVTEPKSTVEEKPKDYSRLVKDIPLVIIHDETTKLDPSFASRFSTDDLAGKIASSVAYHTSQLFDKYQLPETLHHAYSYVVPNPTANQLCYGNVKCLNVLYFYLFQTLETLDPTKVSVYLKDLLRLSGAAARYAELVMWLVRFDVQFYMHEFSQLMMDVYSHSPNTESMANYTPEARHHTIDGIKVHDKSAFTLVWHRSLVPTIDEMFDYIDEIIDHATVDVIKQYLGSCEYFDVQEENMIIRLLKQLYRNTLFVIDDKPYEADEIIQHYLDHWMFGKDTLIPKYQSTQVTMLDSIRFYRQAEQIWVSHMGHYVAQKYPELSSYHKLDVNRYQGKSYVDTPINWRFGEPVVPSSRFDHNQINPTISRKSIELKPMKVTPSPLYSVNVNHLTDWILPDDSITIIQKPLSFYEAWLQTVEGNPVIDPELVYHIDMSTQEYGEPVDVEQVNIYRKQLADLRLQVAQLFDRQQKPRIAWVRRLGHYLIKEVSFKIGSKVIDKHNSDWLEAWSRMTETDTYAYDKMIGHTADLYEYNDKPKPKKTLYIPLQFYFCRDSGLALPLVASSTECSIQVKLRDLNELVYMEPNASLDVKLGEMKLYAEYVFVDTDERTLFVTKYLEYLIEQTQTNCTTETTIKYPFYHPTKLFVNIARPNQHINVNRSVSCDYWPNERQYDNYSLLPRYDHSQLHKDQLALLDAIDVDIQTTLDKVLSKVDWPEFHLNKAEICIYQLVKNYEYLLAHQQNIAIDFDVVNSVAERIYSILGLDYDLYIDKQLTIDELIQIMEIDLVREIDRAVVTRDALLTVAKAVYFDYYSCWAAMNAYTVTNATVEPLQISYKVLIANALGMFSKTSIVDAWFNHVPGYKIQKLIDLLEEQDEKIFNSISFHVNRNLPLNPVMPTVIKRTLKLDQDILDESDFTQANSIQSYLHYESYPTGIDSYSFGLAPLKLQPSGSVNLSRVSLQATYELASSDITLISYVRSYNLIKYMSGSVQNAWE